MLPQQQQHVFSHQHYPGPDWQQPHHNHHAHAQAQAAAAAAAQQQHYGRLAAGSAAGIHENTGGADRGPLTGQGGANGQVNGNAPVDNENRLVLEWIAQMMRSETRESALLELSKKREQVPELALILWHSFGAVVECGSGEDMY